MGVNVGEGLIRRLSPVVVPKVTGSLFTRRFAAGMRRGWRAQPEHPPWCRRWRVVSAAIDRIENLELAKLFTQQKELRVADRAREVDDNVGVCV